MHRWSLVYFWIEQEENMLFNPEYKGLRGGNEGQGLLAKSVPITRWTEGEAGTSRALFRLGSTVNYFQVSAVSATNHAAIAQISAESTQSWKKRAPSVKRKHGYFRTNCFFFYRLKVQKVCSCSPNHSASHGKRAFLTKIQKVCFLRQLLWDISLQYSRLPPN